MNYAIEARKVANLVSVLYSEQLFFIDKKVERCDHIGALITDIILQAGLNYEHVVLPRIKYLIKEFPEAHSLTGFIKIINKFSLEVLLKWNHPVKIKRIEDVIDFLLLKKIYSCNELNEYLSSTSNQKEFLKVKGVGPKTLDYTLKLLSCDIVAVDRHIYSFVSLADVKISDYESTKRIVEFAADFLRVPRSSLDRSIWLFMSKKNKASIPPPSFNKHIEQIFRS